ncbi:MAG: TolC family protein [Acidobacteria bacterium]|nr:MAG: TolC family protein [Acidobacteriota bacterium]
MKHTGRAFRIGYGTLMTIRKLLFPSLGLLLVGTLPALGQAHKIDVNPEGINFAVGRPWTQTLFGQKPIAVAPLQLTNSPRVLSLVHDGKLYLSLDDAIALALENNLDIAIQRYNLPIADTDILRAKAGSAPRGVSTGVVSGTPGGPGATTGVAGAGGAGAGGTSVGAGGAGAGAGGIVTSTLGGGPAVPQLDPVLDANFNVVDQVTPSNSKFITSLTGLPSIQSHSGLANFTYDQGFLTGAALSVGYTNTRSSSESSFSNLFNPQYSSGLTFSFSQPLLQGFGIELNSRNLTQAKDDREIADIAFSQQVMATVAQVEDIYWNVVTANESVKNAQEAVALAQKTLGDTQRQVEIGTMAPLQVTQAKANLATNQGNLIAAQTNLEFNGLLLKNAITKNLANPALAGADVVTINRISLPANQPIQPVQDLVKLALQYRPELAATRINLSISEMSLKATENELKPILNLNLGYNSNALQSSYGGTFGDIFRGRFPTYQAGFSLQIPLRNHAAQADVARAQLQLQQSYLQQQQQINNIVISVEQAQFALQSSRAQILAAQDAVTLNRETLEADQKKLNLGATTVTQVLTDQSNLTDAESKLVSAQSAYIQNKVNLERLTGRTLVANRISILDAENGKVTQMPHARQ